MSFDNTLSTTRTKIKHYNTMKIMVVVLSIMLIINFVGDLTFRQSQIEINENFNNMFQIQTEWNEKTIKIIELMNEQMDLMVKLIITLGSNGQQA